jgi:hypothetical protein
MIRTGIFAADRPRWLDARLLYLTASDAAIALEVSRYRDRQGLLEEKAGLRESSYEHNEQQELGLLLEPTIARVAMARWGWNLVFCGELIVDSACPTLASTPDYLMDTPWGLGVVQVKTTTAKAQEDINPTLKDGSPSTAMFAKGPPLDYVLQVQAEMACVGARLGCLLVGHFCAPGFKVRAYPVLRHDVAVDRIRTASVAFMRDVNRLKEQAA